NCAGRFRPSADGLHGGLGLLRNLGVEAIPQHDDALVTALSDQVHAVMRADLERQLAAVDGDQLGIDLYRESDRRRGQMRDVDMRAERTLARLQVRLHQLRTGPP